ncbi:MAG: hypothetical protein H6718_27455 [Polyangiaceae bacterium]|nr:hypothetical protein [Myxococcales bacterium]MCB9589181.1 hypothetical protein [Polyangiaceae bacterium]
MARKTDLPGMNWNWLEKDPFFGYAQAEGLPVELAVLFMSGRLFCYWQRQGDHQRLGEVQVYEC